MVRDRRGVTAVTFAIMAVVLLSLVGLTAEAGLWIMTRNGEQIVSDNAAIAAALSVYEASGQSGAAAIASSAAEDSISLNGWDSASNQPMPFSTNVIYPPATNPVANAVSVVETQVIAQIQPIIATLLTKDSTPFNAGVQSIAGLVPIGSACVLSTGSANDLTIGAGQLATNCFYVSDATDNGAITVNTAANVNVYGFVTPGNCKNCAEATQGFHRPVSEYQPPVVDPFLTTIQHALQASLPGSVKCVQSSDYQPPGTHSQTRPLMTLVPATGIPGDATYTQPPPGGPYWVNCNTDVLIASGVDVQLTPGIYFFYNASLTVQNGASIACVAGVQPCDVTGLIAGTGVTFVFTGAAGPGNPTSTGPNCDTAANGNAPRLITLTSGPPSGPALKMCPGANVLLSPPSTSDTYTTQNFWPQLRGVLFWRDGQLAPGSAVAPVADIQAANPFSSFSGISAPTYTILNGLMYFPGGFVNFGANSPVFGGSVPQVACATLVAGGINLVNQGSIFQDCAVRGFQTPQVLAVRILQ